MTNPWAWGSEPSSHDDILLFILLSCFLSHPNVANRVTHHPPDTPSCFFFQVLLTMLPLPGVSVPWQVCYIAGSTPCKLPSMPDPDYHLLSPCPVPSPCYTSILSNTLMESLARRQTSYLHFMWDQIESDMLRSLLKPQSWDSMLAHSYPKFQALSTPSGCRPWDTS